MTEDALECFTELLAAAGVDPDAASPSDVGRAIDAAQRFSSVTFDDADPREDDGDMFLAQFGTHDWGEGDSFEVDLTRQFSFSDAEGEYVRLEQLHLTFSLEPTAALRALGSGNLWSSDVGIDAFFGQVRELPAFALSLVPRSVTLTHEEV